jgi:pimeloyl-ACP methyl ester carboxylesterase
MKIATHASVFLAITSSRPLKNLSRLAAFTFALGLLWVGQSLHAGPVVTLSGAMGSGVHWNSTGWWSDGNSVLTSEALDPTTTYVVLSGAILRTPPIVGPTNFPGTIANTLTIQGDGVYQFSASGSVAPNIGTLIPRGTGTGPCSVGFPRLIMNGGEIGIVNNLYTISGEIDIRTNTPFFNIGASDVGYIIPGYLTGSGSIEYRGLRFATSPFAGTNSTRFTNCLAITCTTNTFFGQWKIFNGALLGVAPGCLGTNTITLGTSSSNGIFGACETLYNLTNSQGDLIILNSGTNYGRFYLHQSNTFRRVIVGVMALDPGTYSYAQLNTSFPNNFPLTWTRLNGSAISNASGSITVLQGAPPTTLTQPVSVTNYVGQTVQFTATVGGSPPLYYQWQAGSYGSGTYTNLVEGGNFSGTTNMTLTIANISAANALNYVLVATNNNGGSVTSSVASLTLGPPPITGGIFNYSSFIDPISNLTARYFYPVVTSNLTLLVVMHGYSGDSSSYNFNTYTNLAAMGFFVLAPDMRGRGGDGGSPDDSGREIMDIYDAVAYARTHFPVSPDYAALFGESGGGGNTIAAAAKIPDLFSVYVSYYGMSDYGFSPSVSWYAFVGPASNYAASMRLHIGGDSTLGTPANFPDAYQARDATEAIGKNLLGGFLYLFENSRDSVVNATNTTRVANSMLAAGNSRYYMDISSTLYVHQYPTAPTYLPDSTALWASAIMSQTNAPWTMPQTGSVRVLGYLVTKRFSIWLGTGTTQVADVAYNTLTGTYSFTPVTTNGLNIHLTQGAMSLSTNISAPGTLSLNIPFPPSLHIASPQQLLNAQALMLTWTNNGCQVRLEASTNLLAGWNQLSSPWSTNNNWITTTVTNSTAVRFYRLRTD